jgi:hypothetical protein
VACRAPAQTAVPPLAALKFTPEKIRLQGFKLEQAGGDQLSRRSR